jgi:hypothetical protein
MNKEGADRALLACDTRIRCPTCWIVSTKTVSHRYVHQVVDYFLTKKRINHHCSLSLFFRCAVFNTSFSNERPKVLTYQRAFSAAVFLRNSAELFNYDVWYNYYNYTFPRLLPSCTSSYPVSKLTWAADLLLSNLVLRPLNSRVFFTRRIRQL